MSATPELFEVRYPDGDKVRLRAFLAYYTPEIVSLVGEGGDGKRVTVFVALLSSGVTVTRLQSTE